MPKFLFWAVVTGLMLATPAFAKKPLNLSAFAGKYTGTVVFTNPGDTTSGTATVIITVPKNGKSAAISYVATTVSSMGDVSVLPAEFTFLKNKTMSTTDLGVGIAGTNNAHPGTGNWSQRKRTLSFSATNGDINLNGTASAKDVRKKRKLNLTLISADAGGTYTFTTTLTAKLPKPKK